MFDIPPILLQIALAVPVLTALQLLVLNLVDRNARAARIGRTLGRLPVRSTAARRTMAQRIGQIFRRVAQLTLERVSVMRGGEAEASAALLRAAGFRSRDAVLVHAFLKLVLPVAGLLLTVLWFAIARDETTRWWVVLIWSCGVALGLSMAPEPAFQTGAPQLSRHAGTVGDRQRIRA